MLYLGFHFKPPFVGVLPHSILTSERGESRSSRFNPSGRAAVGNRPLAHSRGRKSAPGNSPVSERL